MLLIAGSQCFAQDAARSKAIADLATLVSDIAFENEGKSNCLPPKTSMASLMGPISQYASQHPEKRSISNAEIQQVLSNAFPCSAKTVALVNQDAKADPGNLGEQVMKVKTITPIYSQLLLMPAIFGFKVGFEETNGASYIKESVPEGETVNRWTQMITVTGYKEFASKPELTPKIYLENKADAFRRVCPNSFAAKGIWDGKLSGFETLVAVVSCGSYSSAAGKTSETALIAVIKGQADFYTVQWAERGEPSEAPMAIDTPKWEGRFKALNPIKLCPRVPGEMPPYPSCVAQ
jgi:hypothetical protein